MVLRIESIRNGCEATGRYLKHVAIDSAKVAALSGFIYGSVVALESVPGVVLKSSMPSLSICLIAPVAEEIIFRGFLMNGVKISQKIWNKIRNHRETPEHLNSQKIFRTRITAAAFGLVHLLNGVSIQPVITGILGVSWGYTAERTNSCAIGIFLHFANNFIAQAVIINAISWPIGAPLWIISYVFNIYIIQSKGNVREAAINMGRDTIRSIIWCVVKISAGGHRVIRGVVSISDSLINSTQDLVMPRHLLAVG